MAIDSPEVEEPMIATTLSFSISFFVARTAWLGSLLESSMMICTGTPLIPPSLLIHSWTMRAVSFSGCPRNDAPPVMEATKPILIGSAAMAGPVNQRQKNRVYAVIRLTLLTIL